MEAALRESDLYLLMCQEFDLSNVKIKKVTQ